MKDRVSVSGTAYDFCWMLDQLIGNEISLDWYLGEANTWIKLTVERQNANKDSTTRRRHESIASSSTEN